MGETRILTQFNPFILEYFLGLARNRVTIIFSLFVKCAPSPIFPSYSELSQFIGVETPDRCPASFFMLPLLCICVIIPHEIFVKCQNTKLYFILIIRILVETCRHIKTSTLYYDTSSPVSKHQTRSRLVTAAVLTLLSAVVQHCGHLVVYPRECGDCRWCVNILPACVSDNTATCSQPR